MPKSITVLDNAMPLLEQNRRFLFSESEHNLFSEHAKKEKKNIFLQHSNLRTLRRMQNVAVPISLENDLHFLVTIVCVRRLLPILI